METEKRLIDANALTAVFEAITNNTTYPYFHIDEIIDEIKNAPTVDAVEVVRCKDCKHWWKANELCVHPKCCKGIVSVVEAPKTHFCSYGERKDNG